MKFLPFLSINVVDIICCTLLACIVDVRCQYDVVGHKCGEQVDPDSASW